MEVCCSWSLLLFFFVFVHVFSRFVVVCITLLVFLIFSGLRGCVHMCFNLCAYHTVCTGTGAVGLYCHCLFSILTC